MSNKMEKKNKKRKLTKKENWRVEEKEKHRKKKVETGKEWQYVKTTNQTERDEYRRVTVLKQ